MLCCNVTEGREDGVVNCTSIVKKEANDALNVADAFKINWLTTFPGFKVEALKGHLLKTIQTTIGHMHRLKQNI